MDNVEIEKQTAQTLIINNEDEVRLARLGKKQVMKRNFNVWSLLFMCFCTSVTWEAMCSTMAQALNSGGSSSMVWGFLAAACGALLIALCLSEMASMIPTAGGQYHYVAELAPPKYRRIFSWYAGWITIWGWILSSTAGMFAVSMQIQAWVILYNPTYSYQRWHTSLILIAQATIFLGICLIGTKWLHYTTFIAMATHIAGYFAVIIYLLVMVKPKNTAKFVFTNQTNLSGWESNGVAWSIGLLSASLGFIGWDSSSHLAEEMKHASRDLPRTMWGSVLISGLLTFPWVIALMFCITDIAGVLAGPVGRISPLVQLLYNISGGDQGQTIGLTMWLPLISFITSGAGVVSATSRVIWSFAREKGLPEFLAKVDKRRMVPINALVFTWFCICALSLIYIGNASAFYGLASGCTVVFIVSYAAPILVSLIWGLHTNGLTPGPFTLGKWNRPISILALCWSIYISIFLCFPTTKPITPANMNYAIVVLAFGFMAPMVAWFIYGHRTYLGAVMEIDAEIIDSIPTELNINTKTD